jgi:hypothetical protein
MTFGGSLAIPYQNAFTAKPPFIIVLHREQPRSIDNMNEDLSTYIIRELGKPRARKIIIRNVCQRSGLNWRAAEQYVALVEAQYRRKMAGRRTPPLLFLSLVILLLGTGLLGFNLQALIVFFQQNMPGQVASFHINDVHVTMLLAGLGLSVGGLFGLWKAYGILFAE